MATLGATPNIAVLGGLTLGTTPNTQLVPSSALGSISNATDYATLSSGSTTLWSANHDAGNLAEWDLNGGGGEFNSGGGDATASTTYKRSGTHSCRLRTNTPADGESGTRMFRWEEPRENRELYFETWHYLPNIIYCGANQWNNIWQMKSRNQSGSLIDSFWQLTMRNRSGSPAGANYAELEWHSSVSVEGPRSGDGISGKIITPDATIPDFPIGQWFGIRTFLRQSKDFDGDIQIWFDVGSGFTLIWQELDVRTGYSNTNYNAWQVSNEWSVNNYGEVATPAPADIYVDDARIYTAT